MLRKLLSALLFVAMFVPLAFAQTGSISGTVTDTETGETVPTANVLLVEIQRGTATNAEGNYNITNVPTGTYTLRVSFVGYQTFTTKVTIQANQETTQNVALNPGAVGLDELVVTGYGIETKRELTGSITKVSSEDFKDVPAQNTESLLQGRAAGVQVTTTSGNPGGGFEVRVRGEGSIDSENSPLYIVDGVQIGTESVNDTGGAELNDVSPLNSIRAEDIESIEVLKDAAAAAIYGSQAANGVVIITTKRGQQGDTRITANVEAGVRTTSNRYDMVETPEWIDYHVEAWGEATVRSVLVNDFGYAADIPFDQVRNTDWQDFIYRTGDTRKASISASGGDDQTRFFISGGWENTQAQVRDVSFERFNMRTNFDHQFSEKLSSRFNINLTHSDVPGVCQDGFFINCPISQAFFEPPVAFPFLDDGSYNPNVSFGRANNLAVIFAEEDRDTKVTQIIGNIQPTYNFTNWLSLTALAGIDWRGIRETDFESPIADPGDGGSVSEQNEQRVNLNLNAVLNGRYTFDDVHNVSGLIGTEYRRDFRREVQVVGEGLPNGLLKVISATATPGFTQGVNTEFRIASYFAQAKYNFDERYFVTLIGRYDGSSRFGSEDRWGFFPSASVGWRISEEDFFNVNAIDDLKLRVSYGVTGNAGIGNFASRGLFEVSGSYQGVTGLAPDRLANAQLTWEEATEINVGVDWSAWGGRLSGSIDVYSRTNDNLLLDRPLPRDSGFGSITENIGEVENQGIEFEFETVNVDRAGLLWTSRFNIAVQKNEVKELQPGVELLDPSDDDPIAVGQSLEAFWVPRWAGVNPADGRPMWLDANGNITYDPDVADNAFFDGGEQDVIGGLGNRFSYKGLSLDIFFQYSFGQTAQPQTEFFFGQDPSFFGVWDKIQNRWRQPGDTDASIVRPVPFNFFPSTAAPTTQGTNSLWDASYIRLKSATLSYNLPLSIVDKIGLRGLRLYATGLNLVTWTSWPALDPEVAGNEISSSFPSARQVNGGIEVQF